MAAHRAAFAHFVAWLTAVEHGEILVQACSFG
jgi:hypothetical protein